MNAPILAFCGFFICATGAASPPSPRPGSCPAPSPGKASAAEFDWTKFGQSLRAAMPKDVREGSTLRQVQYLAEQTAEKLAGLGIAPNFDETGRKRAREKFQDPTLGACGHTALCLKQVWLGAGFPDKTCKTLIVLKRQANGQLLNEINADHAAMVYLHPDGPVVFDLWCEGRARKTTFAHFRASVWKAMPVGEWARRMGQEGYTHSGCQEHPELGETPPLELPTLLRKLQPRQAKPSLER